MPAAGKGDKEPREGDGEEKRPRQRKPKLGNPDADPVRVHREYVERRLGGGADASPEAYARALEQWHRLPGALSTPPAEVRREDAESALEEGEGARSEAEDVDDKGQS